MDKITTFMLVGGCGIMVGVGIWAEMRKPAPVEIGEPTISFSPTPASPIYIGSPMPFAKKSVYIGPDSGEVTMDGKYNCTYKVDQTVCTPAMKEGE